MTALFMACISLLPACLLGQQEYLVFAESVEEMLTLTEDTDPASLLEELSDLREFPVKINSGDEKEISRIFFLTEFQVKVLADHIRRNGSVVTLFELALLPAFDRSTAMLLAPYISLDTPGEEGVTGYDRTTVTMTATTCFSQYQDEREGVRSLLKVRHERERISFGLTAENDPGERFSLRNAPGSDFLSGHLVLRGKNIIDRIIVGDYALRFGEGVVMNSSRWLGSWLSSPSFMSGRSSAVSYTSSEENDFFRGISVAVGDVNSGALFFASRNMIDARPLYNGEGTVTAVSNLVTGGLHVTESQQAARNSLTETVAGLRLTAGAEKIRGGLTATSTWFSLPFRPDTTSPEKIHAFEGDRLLNLAADFRAGTGPVLLFAEAAISLPGSWAATAGVRAKPSGRVTFNMLCRHFSPDFYAFHSGAFKAGSGAGNETGIAASLHIEAARHLFISAATDNYRIPGPRYRSSSPSYGSRMEIKGEYLPRDDATLRISYASSSREYDSATERGTARPVKHARQQATFVFSCMPAPGLHLATRASASFIRPSEEKGYLLCQDISCSFPGVPLRLWLRYLLCSTGGWESRLYAWENDMLSSFSVPALHGESARSFIMISWKPSQNIEARFKYACADSDNGLKHEVKGQVRILFQAVGSRK